MLGVRFLRFLLVGGLNTAFGYGVFALLLAVGLHYSIAAFGSTVMGTLFNFFTTGNLVFRDRRVSRLLPFVAVYGVVYGFSVGGLRIGEWLGVSAYLTGAVLLLPNALLAYLLQRAFVFTRPRGKP